jgi:hypothetical protein
LPIALATVTPTPIVTDPIVESAAIATPEIVAPEKIETGAKENILLLIMFLFVTTGSMVALRKKSV